MNQVPPAKLLVFQPLPLLFELIPFCIQAIGIGALLIVTRGEPAQALFATIAGLIWIKTSHHRGADDWRSMRAHRRLFAAVGKWLDRETDALQEYDGAIAATQLIAPSIEHEDFAAIATAIGIANTARQGASAFLYVVVLVQAGLWLLS